MNNNFLTNGFETWQAFAKTYTEMTLASARQSVDYAFALRKQYGELTLDVIKQSQALYAREQEIALEAAEMLSAQTQSTVERVSKIVETSSKN
mgnify:CR=1 FL=1